MSASEDVKHIDFCPSVIYDTDTAAAWTRIKMVHADTQRRLDLLSQSMTVAGAAKIYLESELESLRAERDQLRARNAELEPAFLRAIEAEQYEADRFHAADRARHELQADHDALAARSAQADAAVRTLGKLGYTFHGGELWKPPLGSIPRWITDPPTASPAPVTQISDMDHGGAMVDTQPLIGVDYPECSGDPSCCPENEGFGCCKPNPQPAPEPVCCENRREGDCCGAFEEPATEPAQAEVVGYVPASDISLSPVKGSLPTTLWREPFRMHEPVALVRLSTLESVRAENSVLRSAQVSAEALIDAAEVRAESAERERDAYETAVAEAMQNHSIATMKWITNRVAELMGDTK